MTDQENQQHSGAAPSFRVSRRNFLRAAGVGGAAIATAGAGVTVGTIPFQASRAYAQGAWDEEFDVIVVGSGGAGQSAAATAHSLGDSVVIFEKGETSGGTTGKSGGVYWIPNNSIMVADGLTDPKAEALQYLARCAYPQLYNPSDPTLGVGQDVYDLLGAFYDNGSVAIDHLGEIGALASTYWITWDGQPGPDYYAQLPEDKAPRGRALSPLKDDGTAGAGAELIDQLQRYLEAEGVPIRLSTRVVSVVMDENGEVIGVETVANTAPFAATPATEAGASPVAEPARSAVRATKGVIFGSGGFTQNPEMRVNYLRGPIFGGCAVPTNEGDFITIGIDAGAALGNLANAFWAEVPVEQAIEFSSTPSDVFTVPGDSMIIVNKYGQRVVNEKFQYNERTQVHFIWDPVAAEFPNLMLPMIFDQRAAELIGGTYPVPGLDTNSPLLIQGETWAELAAAIRERYVALAAHTGGVQLSDDFETNLAATVERFNGFAETGVDEDFQRGESPIQLAFNGPPAEDNTSPNPTMFPLAAEGPYYAILLGGGTLDTKGGPKVNTNAQVVTVTGEPIVGLYGAGNCISSPAGQAYWAAGGTIGPALAFGYIAAAHANAQPARTA